MNQRFLFFTRRTSMRAVDPVLWGGKAVAALRVGADAGLLPGAEFAAAAMQLRDQVRLAGGEVGFLGRIGGEILKFERGRRGGAFREKIPAGDEFPFPEMHGRVRIFVLMHTGEPRAFGQGRGAA